MLQRRELITVACVILIPGSVSAALLFALHIQADSYRRAAEEMLGDRLGMNVSIGAVRSNGFGGRLLRDVHVTMGSEGTEVFTCAEAVWEHASQGGTDSHTLELRDGWLLLGSAGWSRAEYERLLAGGLGHDFAALGLTEIRLHNIDLRFHPTFADFTAEGASGVILFDKAGDGRADLKCSRLNGFDVAEPVSIQGWFTPGETLVFHEVALSVASIPLSALGVGGMSQRTPSRGEFRGVIRYYQAADAATVDVTGSLHAADLRDFTGNVPGGPYHGTLDLDVESAVYRHGRLETLIGHGTVADLRISELMPGFSRPMSAGRLDLQIDPVRWIDGRMAYLSLTGRCEDLSLDALSTVWGAGRITGSVAINIRSATIVNDQLTTAEVHVETTVPDDEPGRIDRALLARAAKAWSGIDLTLALPDQIEYTRLGARLLLNDDELTVLGSHGPNRRTILSVNVFGRSWGVIKQPERTFHVPDLLEWLRSHEDELDADRVRSWWESLQQLSP